MSKRKRFEIIEDKFETVEDYIKLLSKVPKGYKFIPLGANIYKVIIDRKNKCLYVDEDYSFLEEEENFEDEMIEEEDKDRIFCVIGYSKQTNDYYDSSLFGTFSTLELATECGDELVEAGVINYYQIEAPLLDEFGYK